MTHPFNAWVILSLTWTRCRLSNRIHPLLPELRIVWWIIGGLSFDLSTVFVYQPSQLFACSVSNQVKHRWRRYSRYPCTLLLSAWFDPILGRRVAREDGTPVDRPVKSQAYFSFPFGRSFDSFRVSSVSISFLDFCFFAFVSSWQKESSTASLSRLVTLTFRVARAFDFVKKCSHFKTPN